MFLEKISKINLKLKFPFVENFLIIFNISEFFFLVEMCSFFSIYNVPNMPS